MTNYGLHSTEHQTLFIHSDSLLIWRNHFKKREEVYNRKKEKCDNALLCYRPVDSSTGKYNVIYVNQASSGKKLNSRLNHNRCRCGSWLFKPKTIRLFFPWSTSHSDIFSQCLGYNRKAWRLCLANQPNQLEKPVETSLMRRDLS